MIRFLLPTAHRVRRRLLAWTGWPTRGAKAMAFDRAGRVLLVRHAYGRSDLYMLPGGGIGRGEQPVDAAVRELQEETGCRLQAPELVARYEASAEGRRDMVFLFRGITEDQPVADAAEVIEAAFFALDSLPPNTSPATRRRIEEATGRRPVSQRW